MDDIKRQAQRLRYHGSTYYLHAGAIYNHNLDLLIPEATNGFLDLYEYFEYFPQNEKEEKNVNNLKHHRRRSGLTQSELAVKTGISVRTLQDYEQGRKPLTGAAASTVLKMARVLGLSLLSDVEDLIDG